MNTRRAYTMTSRAESAAETRRAILQAAFDLSSEKIGLEIVLADVAERAGVTVKTILRHFGRRDSLFEAVRAFGQQEIVDERSTPVGDVDAAVSVLHAHYELRGEWVLRMLSQEHSDPRVHEIAEAGRVVHRDWVRATFRPQLDGLADESAAIDLLVVATDVYAWKLLRRDLGLDRAAAEDRVRTLVRAVLAHDGRT